MTVYLPSGGKTWYLDFTWRGVRHNHTTHQLRKADAQLVESNLKLKLRQQLAGIAPLDAADTPRFADWAEVYAETQRQFVRRPDLIDRVLSVLLEFWGARPKTPKRRPLGTNTKRGDAPYHDRRLGDPLLDPSWLLRFEEWMAARGISGSTRNSYLSAMSGLYRLAQQPEWQGETHITRNPFLGIRRSPTNSRVIALDVQTVKRWIHHAPPHVRTAMAIAALAPKLRLRTIMDLQWAVHFDRTLTRITVETHKTRGRSGLAQVTPIDAQLRAILLEAKERAIVANRKLRRRDRLRFVITYHGHRVYSITKATKRAAEAAGLTWGVRDGVTFHTVRHSIATLLAELEIGERLRMELMGHSEMRTTQKYTHLAARTQVTPHAQLAAALTLRDVMPVEHTDRPRSGAVSETRSRTDRKPPKTGQKPQQALARGSHRRRA